MPSARATAHVTRLLLLGLLLASCAPTLVAPSILRLPAVDQPQALGLSLTARLGPRVPTTLAAIRSNRFNPQTDSWRVPELGVAYDLSLQKPLAAGVSLHVGVQGEFFYPLPFPGYGVTLGISKLIRGAHWSVAPSLATRAATDFGLRGLGGPGSFVAVDGAITLALLDGENAALGVAPFVSGVFSFGATRDFVGVVGALGFARYRGWLLQGGAARALLADGTQWTVPMLGLGFTSN